MSEDFCRILKTNLELLDAGYEMNRSKRGKRTIITEVDYAKENMEIWDLDIEKDCEEEEQRMEPGKRGVNKRGAEEVERGGEKRRGVSS